VSDDSWKGEHLISAKPTPEQRHLENARLGNVVAKARGHVTPLQKRIAHGNFTAWALGAKTRNRRPLE
jgi:hypothetical protein